MAITKILFQGLVDDNFHLDAIKKISELENISELIFCVSFAPSEVIPFKIKLFYAYFLYIHVAGGDPAYSFFWKDWEAACFLFLQTCRLRGASPVLAGRVAYLFSSLLFRQSCPGCLPRAACCFALLSCCQVLDLFLIFKSQTDKLLATLNK
jgi:hypothetical protein